MPIWVTLSTAILSFALAGVIGWVLIPYLKKLHFGQTILEEGPRWHKNKQGTPIMGGFMFIISSIVSLVVGYLLYRFCVMVDVTDAETSRRALRVFACIVFSVLYSAIGFADDYIKAIKKQNLGLTAKQKTLFQVILCGALLAVFYALGDRATTVNLCFIELDFGLFYYPLMVVVMYYLSNAVNLTDGVDGLCGTVTVVSMLALTVLSSMMDLHELSLYSIALAGGCMGFLIWNLHPAKCFMGDTGSMYLGGAFVAVGMMTRQHLLLVLIGLVYVLEALSVVIQVSYFKITARQHFKKTGEKGKGKRIFKMSPIHHHFEMSGFSEYKIVVTFSLFGLLMGAAALGLFAMK
ncbi:MAG: phospho-N-acetylmuramoyl-pentapeptide-transferase [Ruminococcus sp.]|nr:phospho-N-acetylmuramoyl-pentapeptide-transferase [Ruminococcus sp.]